LKAGVSTKATGSGFKIEKESAEKGVVIVRLTGYLDAHTFERLEETIGELFGQAKYKIVVDLSQVEYISSAGAGVFIGALSEAHEHKGNIVLMNPTANVREVFDLLGLTQIFQVVDDRGAALAVF
jgi:anti-sigma B factor antagonist